MTLPVTIRVNVRAPFPALVEGSGFIVVSKNSGIWTIKADYTQLSTLLASADLPGAVIAIYDPITKQYNQVTVAQIISAGSSAGSSTYRVVTATGNVIVLSSDVVILLQSTGPCSILLPASASRNGIPITVKDYNYTSGRGGAGNPITFVPSGAETIDGFSAAAAAANGVALMNINGSSKTLKPLTAGGWYL